MEDERDTFMVWYHKSMLSLITEKEDFPLDTNRGTWMLHNSKILSTTHGSTLNITRCCRLLNEYSDSAILGN